MWRYLTAGESHGAQLLGILAGLPAGVPLVPADIDGYLWRRQGGAGRGARMRIERDRVAIMAGVWQGLTSGTPLGLTITNRGAIPQAKQPRRTVPRPGHADLTGMLKHGFDDANPAIERASARETAMRVALGAAAQTFLRALGIGVAGHVVAVGGVSAALHGDDWDRRLAARDASPLACADAAAEAEMLARIDEARSRKETLGGVAEVVALGVPPGLGSYAQWDRRLGAELARALASIPSVKAVAVGDALTTSAGFGRDAQDELFWDEGVVRRTNHAGGLEGGITNGASLVLRAFFKPIPTQRRPLRSVDLATGSEEECRYIRSDTLVVPAGSVVAEAMVALTLAGAVVEKFGGDSLADTRAAFAAYLARIPWHQPELPEALRAASAAPADAGGPAPDGAASTEEE
ncbi:MAG: chorismate synthase [Gemmatimonadota bacterium]